jgi:uncharacterized caspase-like protein
MIQKSLLPILIALLLSLAPDVSVASANSAPALYVLAIGVGQYRSADVPKLTYAAKDASDFAAAMSAQKGLVYANVVPMLLTDRAASHDGILKGLNWIETRATKADIAMIFFSGHGLRDKSGAFYLGSSDIDPRAMPATGISEADLARSVQSIPCAVLVFIDACHAGSVESANIMQSAVASNDILAPKNHVVIFLSATGPQLSKESSKWQNGAFTKAVVEGLRGKAADATGQVTWQSLSYYASNRVKALTAGAQSPLTYATVPDFVIARALQ